jgi:hypothetical protein
MRMLPQLSQGYSARRVTLFARPSTSLDGSCAIRVVELVFANAYLKHTYLNSRVSVF